MRLRIDNEYSPLEAVLVHRPGMEIERLNPSNRREYLFEDVPYLRRMQDEHDGFVARMRDHGVEVLYLEALLREVLRLPGARSELVSHVCRAEAVPALAEDLCNPASFDDQRLAGILFAGLTAEEFREASGRRIAPPGGEEQFLIPPIPNAYFTRDPAVVVRETAISCKMHHRARVRESIVTRAVLEHHPAYGGSAAHPVVYGGTSEPTEDRPYTIEGGDVIMLSPEAVLVGASQRTRSETIGLLSGKCFRFGHVQRVYEVPIPSERAFMHLDTVFTVVDRGMVLWFAEVMENVRYVQRYEAEGDGVRRVVETRSLVDVLRDEFGTEITVIDTGGGGKHFAAREQRSDGTNLLAIAPKVAITYERNERTTRELERHGVTCIGIDDSELVRGLGGPRCMTMPLRRRSQTE